MQAAERQLTEKKSSGFIAHYKHHLLSPGTIVTFTSGLFLGLAGLLLLSGQADWAENVFLTSALVGGVYILNSAIRGLMERDFTADVLVSIAISGAIFIGRYEAGAIVAFMLLLGGFLEEFTVASAGRALKELASLVPGTVTIRSENGESSVPIDRVLIGDVLLVKSGERIAVDGHVIGGRASVNQASITGESAPVTKERGDIVFAGTLNELGALEVQATKVGSETTLGNIIRLVEQAQEESAPIQRLVNRYAQFFTPIALIIAGIFYLTTGDVVRSITVLIVFCPCALVLATPTAVVAAIGNAARKGVLIKKGEYLEEIGRISIVAFDKTGTLTFGQPRVRDIIPLNNTTGDTFLALAASAEKFSEHPLGAAIVSAALDRNLDVADPLEFETLPGLGIRASVEGFKVLLGTRQLLEEEGIRFSQETVAQIDELENQGRTVIPVVIDSVLEGLLTTSDGLRYEAAYAVKALHDAGIRTLLISGDNPRTAALIGAELGISEVYSQVLPQDKLALVRKLQAEGHKVAFVGDGVNDAPALAAANIGIAMGATGTDVSIENADIALLSDDLSRIPQIIALSRKTLSVIQVNIVFSLGVNFIAVALAGVSIIGPVAGAILHELSSLPVIANSARLLGYRHKTNPS